MNKQERIEQIERYQETKQEMQQRLISSPATAVSLDDISTDCIHGIHCSRIYWKRFRTINTNI